jgi:hypothetical protein
MRSRCAVCVCASVYTPIVARQRLGKNPLVVARQGLDKDPPPPVARQWLGKYLPVVARQRLGRNVTAVTNTHATVEEFEVLTAVLMKSTIFWDITPCSPLKINGRFGGTYRLHLQLYLPSAFTLVSCSAYFSTMKMEAACSSQTSINFQRNTRRYIPEDITLQRIFCWSKPL